MCELTVANSELRLLPLLATTRSHAGKGNLPHCATANKQLSHWLLGVSHTKIQIRKVQVCSWASASFPSWVSKFTLEFSFESCSFRLKIAFGILSNGVPHTFGWQRETQRLSRIIFFFKHLDASRERGTRISGSPVRRLNFNLEECAMPAGKQCVGTSRHTQHESSTGKWDTVLTPIAGALWIVQ